VDLMSYRYAQWSAQARASRWGVPGHQSTPHRLALVLLFPPHRLLRVELPCGGVMVAAHVSKEGPDQRRAVPSSETLAQRWGAWEE